LKARQGVFREEEGGRKGKQEGVDDTEIITVGTFRSVRFRFQGVDASRTSNFWQSFRFAISLAPFRAFAKLEMVTFCPRF
jgi:hypothetical protein